MESRTWWAYPNCTHIRDADEDAFGVCQLISIAREVVNVHEHTTREVLDIFAFSSLPIEHNVRGEHRQFTLKLTLLLLPKDASRWVAELYECYVVMLSDVVIQLSPRELSVGLSCELVLKYLNHFLVSNRFHTVRLNYCFWVLTGLIGEENYHHTYPQN